MEELILFSIGLVAGILGGLLGIGGGLVTVPSFLYVFALFGLPQDHAMQTAIGTALGVMIFLGGSSAIAHTKKKGMIWPFLTYFSPAVVIGSIFGALIDDNLPSDQLQLFFSLYVLYFGIRFVLYKKQSEKETQNFTLPSPYLICIVGLITGVISSALGIGGATFTIPFLIYYHVPVHRAISTSAFVTLVVAVAGSLSFLYFGLNEEVVEWNLGYIYLPALIFTGCGAVLTAPLGARLAYCLPVIGLKRLFGVFLIIVGIALW